MDNNVYDPRLTKVLKRANEDAKTAYEAMARGDLDNAKLHLANLIGVQYTLYELYKDDEIEVTQRDPLDDIQHKTERFIDKFKVR